VRVPCTLDLRRFPPVPRATRQFERRYKGRTAVERVNARAQIFWGVDDGNVTGSRRFHAYVGVVMVVCLGFATLLARTKRREGSMGQTRLSPIAVALREEALEGPAVPADQAAAGPGEPGGREQPTPAPPNSS
jgi:hypothetical protein